MNRLFPLAGPESLAAALGILSAMITPALLISATGTLILSTSNRFGRVVDRVRILSDRFEQLSGEARMDEHHRDKLKMIVAQVAQLDRRARFLLRAMNTLYIVIGLFVATSVAIGVIGLWEIHAVWLPVVLGLSGACGLFYASSILIREAMLAASGTYQELDFILKSGQRFAPPGLT